MGCYSLKVDIGPFSAQTEFHVFNKQEPQLLLGYRFLHQHGILIHPGVGLIQATDTCNLATTSESPESPSLHQSQSPDTQKLPPDQLHVEDGQVLLKVRAAKDYFIPPKGQSQVQAYIEVSHLHRHDRARLTHLPLIFHSESLSKHLPLHLLNIPHQYTFTSGEHRAVLKYLNHQSHHVSLHKNQ